MMNIMAPSRGLTAVFHQHAQFSYISRRSVSDFSRIATDPNRKVQAYISRSFDPYVNLSIEHFLLQKSPPESIILFLYTNKPCIVIGRNQNPWVEVNLGLLKKGLGEAEIHLVRRRSGGGAVFHDEGNVNYSVICPTAVFDRDKHAQMVVKALHGLGIKEAKVNERHDIILEAIPKENDIAVMPGSDDAEGQAESAAFKKPFKISGSAYKLTRLRSLHHGTCLLSSPNIKQISKYLRSPAKPYILARGVDSVSSPVANVNVANHAFEQAVVKEFCKMYSLVEPIIVSGEEVEVPEVAKGLAEIKSLDWTFLQTPQFTFSSQMTEQDARERPPLPDTIPSNALITFTARNGAVTEAKLGLDSATKVDPEAGAWDSLIDQKIHQIKDWQKILPQPASDNEIAAASWLKSLFK